MVWIVILLLSVLAALGIGAMVTFWTRNAFLGKRLQESEHKAQAVLEDAMQTYIEIREQSKVRPEVMARYRSSVQRHRLLYELLAK